MRIDPSGTSARTILYGMAVLVFALGALAVWLGAPGEAFVAAGFAGLSLLVLGGTASSGLTWAGAAERRDEAERE